MSLNALNREFFSARPDVGESELLRVLKNELFSAKPDVADSVSARDLKSEDFSAKFETKLNELPKVLVRPLT